MFVLGLVKVENTVKIQVHKDDEDAVYRVRARILGTDERVVFTLPEVLYVPSQGDVLVVSGEIRRIATNVLELHRVRFHPVQHILEEDVKGFRSPTKALRVIAITPLDKVKIYEKVIDTEIMQVAREVYKLDAGLEGDESVEQEADQNAREHGI